MRLGPRPCLTASSVLLTAALLLPACSTASTPELAAGPSASETVEGLSCPEIPGLVELLEPSTVLLLGEMHGTREAPAFTGSVVCQALARGLPVTVGLEIDRADDNAYQAYLASNGDAAARQALLASPFWHREFQDGRSSRAMLELLERLRQLSARGAGDDPALHLVLIDQPSAGADRDRAMAERLGEAIAARPQDLFVVLTGNIHNRLTRGMSWNPDLEPMGHRLARGLGTDHRLVSLDMAYPGGTAWVCFGSAPEDCKAQELGGSEAARGKEGIELFEGGTAAEGETRPYSGRYFVGEISASAPVVGQEESEP